MDLNKIVNFLNEYLKIAEIKDFSVNGLQVQGKKEVEKIVFGVDACQSIFNAAKNEDADMVVVHHGIIWGGIKSITGITYERIKFLIENGISLYAAHLPLDMHSTVGNNAQFLKIFEIEKKEEFGNYHELNIGYMGEFKKEKSVDLFVNEINTKLETKCIALKFGKEKIKKVGVVSGGAPEIIEEAIGKVDCFVTGEASHQVYHAAKEAKINVVFAGHYATETLGVKALSSLLEKKFKIKTLFIDLPTGL